MLLKSLLGLVFHPRLLELVRFAFYHVVEAQPLAHVVPLCPNTARAALDRAYGEFDALAAITLRGVDRAPADVSALLDHDAVERHPRAQLLVGVFFRRDNGALDAKIVKLFLPRTVNPIRAEQLQNIDLANHPPNPAADSDSTSKKTPHRKMGDRFWQMIWETEQLQKTAI